jgi:hypothetical protein
MVGDGCGGYGEVEAVATKKFPIMLEESMYGKPLTNSDRC